MILVSDHCNSLHLFVHCIIPHYTIVHISIHGTSARYITHGVITDIYHCLCPCVMCDVIACTIVHYSARESINHPSIHPNVAHYTGVYDSIGGTIVCTIGYGSSESQS